LHDADVRHVGDRHAHGHHFALTRQRHEGAVLLHEIDAAGNRPVVVELEQIGALFPRAERETAELKHAFELAGQPHARQLGETGENRLADHLLGRQTTVILHEAIPHQHLHLTVEDENTEADTLDNEIA
jgi:hypothetical protein